MNASSKGVRLEVGAGGLRFALVLSARGRTLSIPGLSGPEQGQGRLVQLSIGREAVRALQVVTAVPVGEPTAGLFDDHLKPGDVPDVDPVIDHQVTRPLGQEDKSVVVAKASSPVHAAEYVQELPLLPGLLKELHARVTGEGLVQRTDVRDSDAPVILVRPVSAKGPKQMTLGRGV